MLACIMAVNQLLQSQQLQSNVTFVIEGEEESGSTNLMRALQQAKDYIGKPDMIFVSNSYWIGETIPCITYGLRGVIHARISVRRDGLEPLKILGIKQWR